MKRQYQKTVLHLIIVEERQGQTYKSEDEQRSADRNHTADAIDADRRMEQHVADHVIEKEHDVDAVIESAVFGDKQDESGHTEEPAKQNNRHPVDGRIPGFGDKHNNHGRHQEDQ